MSILAFNRIEKKFIINKEQYNLIINEINKYMKLDDHCFDFKTYKIENIYFDTFNNDLISKSIEKPTYKEKLRLRKYYNYDKYFLEIKKKGRGVVGKRRIVFNEEELEDFLKGKDINFSDYSSIIAQKEIRYLLKRYNLKPVVYLAYDRLGFFGFDDVNLRITFDSNIITRRNDLSFGKIEGDKLIDDSIYIMEIKSINNIPLWLCRIISNLVIKPGSYSKYGEEYKKYIGGNLCLIK